MQNANSLIKKMLNHISNQRNANGNKLPSFLAQMGKDLKA